MNKTQKQNIQALAQGPQHETMNINEDYDENGFRIDLVGKLPSGVHFNSTFRLGKTARQLTQIMVDLVEMANLLGLKRREDA